MAHLWVQNPCKVFHDIAAGPVAVLTEERDRKCQAMRPHIQHVNHRHRKTERENCESAEGKSGLRGARKEAEKEGGRAEG